MHYLDALKKRFFWRCRPPEIERNVCTVGDWNDRFLQEEKADQRHSMTGDDEQRLEYDKSNNEHPQARQQEHQQEQQERQGQEQQLKRQQEELEQGQEQQGQQEQEQQEQGQVQKLRQEQEQREKGRGQERQLQQERQGQEQQLQQGQEAQEEQGHKTYPVQTTTFDSTAGRPLEVTVTTGANDDGILEDGGSQDPDETLARANSGDTGNGGQGRLQHVREGIDSRAEDVRVAVGCAEARGAEGGEQDVKGKDQAELDVVVIGDGELEEIKV